MDDAQFDALTRTFRSRRTALTSLAGGLAALLGLTGPDKIAAHNPLPACKRIKNAARRRACRRRARAHYRDHRTCRPLPVAAACAGRCGSMKNNCEQEVECTCPAENLCLLNQGCGRWCDPGPLSCPAGCSCIVPLAEGAVPFCTPATITECPQVPQVCTSTAQCPIGQFCALTACGPNQTVEGRCAPVCPM